MIHWLKILLHLTKFRISLFAALSTSAGFILSHRGLSGEILPPVLGVFSLACGACALNQYQERRSDRVMERTRRRPLPAGRLCPPTVLKLSFSLVLLGLLILSLGTNWKALGIGISALILYNGVYTPLKKKTAFAALPGALIGAIPPVLGWISDVKDGTAPQIVATALFFFIWQIPHFWLLFLSSGSEYERAGFPALTRIFSSAQVGRITFVWLFGTAVTCLLIPLFARIDSYLIYGGLLVAGGWLVWRGSGLLRPGLRGSRLQTAFSSVNLYAFFVVTLLILGCLSG
jgi:heme o synthase